MNKKSAKLFFTLAAAITQAKQLICDGFLNKESMAQMTLREDAVGVGGNGMERKTSRALSRVHQRKDVRALCMDWGKMRISDYLHYMVNNFSTS